VLAELSVRSFKCFVDERIALKRFNVFAGANGSGKSTILQALLLIHQALRYPGQPGHLPLSGPLLNLGTVRDVVDKVRGGKAFEIEIALLDGTSIRWHLAGGDSPREELAAQIDSISWTNLGASGSIARPTQFLPSSLGEQAAGLAELERVLRRIRYVPANRLGPCEVYPLPPPGEHQTLGPQAELAVGMLHWMRDDPVADQMQHASGVPNRLVRQAEAWMGDIFPGISIDIQKITNANLVSLGIRTGDATDFHRPQNVGFGLAYAIPIVASVLAAKSGDVVIIENPEAHLHPRAQTRIASLCLRAATAGVQVLVETHSDHFLNAVRVAVHQGRLASGQVAIRFFEAGTDGSSSKELSMGPNGRFSERPPGFFDEIEFQLSALLMQKEGNRDIADGA
jgi:predicted ATPase